MFRRKALPPVAGECTQDDRDGTEICEGLQGRRRTGGTRGRAYPRGHAGSSQRPGAWQQEAVFKRPCGTVQCHGHRRSGESGKGNDGKEGREVRGEEAAVVTANGGIGLTVILESPARGRDQGGEKEPWGFIPSDPYNIPLSDL